MHTMQPFGCLLPRAIGALLIAAGALALAGCDRSNSVGSDSQLPSPLPGAIQARFQEVLDTIPREHIAPGAVLSVSHPAYQGWAGSSGLGAVDDNEALTPAHRLRAGSMLKTAIAVAVLQLVEKSALSLTSTLDTVLPAQTHARVPGARAITLQMLLNHTSGLPDSVSGDFDSLVLAKPRRIWSLHDYLDRANVRRRAFAPGTGWAYSNTNYLLLGEVLAFVTGQPWRKVVSDQVFSRAGLLHSSLPPVGNALCTGCARGYHRVGNRLLDITEVDPSMAGAAGGGAWLTTAADLSRFLRALFAGQLFSKPETLALMTSFVPVHLAEEAQTGYGLGLARYETNGVKFWGHLGGTAGFNGFMLYQPETGLILSGYINNLGELGALIAPSLDVLGTIPSPARMGT